MLISDGRMTNRVDLARADAVGALGGCAVALLQYRRFA